MSNLLSLLKIEFSKVFSKNSFKENKVKNTSFIVLLAIIVILGICLSSLYTLIYGELYKQAGLSILPLTILFASVASMLTLFSGINQSRGIFIGKDYDMLSALPITKRTIVSAKVINLYVVELIYSAIIMIPHGIVAFALTGESLVLITSIILAFTISAFPLVIALLFSFITLIFASRFKYGNVVSIILYIILFAGLFFLSFSMSSKSKDINAQANLLTNISGIIKWINPAIYFVDLAHSSNYAFIGIFIAINAFSLIVEILIFALSFDKLHEMVTALKSDYKYTRKELKTKNELKTLLGIELKRLFSSKLYFMNSCSGLIMAVIMSVFAGIACSPISPFGYNENLGELVKTYAFFGGIVITFGITMANPTSVGISMEGKNFWLVKSLPINYKKYMWAKILLSLVIMIPVSLICSTVIVCFVQPDWISILSIYLIPVLLVLFSVVLSLIINLNFYKLRWTNEQEVVKSSTAVWMTMIFGFLGEIVAAALLSIGIFNKALGVFLAIGVTALATIILYVILSKIFERKLYNIEDF